MRVTENTNFDTVRDSIRRSRGRLEELQHQSATLRKLNTPSDDPVGTSKVLELRTEKVGNDQFQMNGKMAETFLNNTDQALGELSEIVLRAKEIAINQSSAASASDSTRAGVAEEIAQLYKQAISTANRRVGDRYLFGGYKTMTPSVDAEGKYLGDDGQMMVEIAKEVFLTMNVPGIEAFNTHPNLSYENQKVYGEPVKKSIEEEPDKQYENVNLFDELQNFRIALLAGDLEGVRDTLDRFDSMHSKLIATRSKLGSRLQGLQSTTQGIERTNLTNAGLTSVLEDADMAQVVSDLTKEENVFKSSLASSKRLIQPTLLDFLR